MKRLLLTLALLLVFAAPAFTAELWNAETETGDVTWSCSGLLGTDKALMTAANIADGIYSNIVVCAHDGDAAGSFQMSICESSGALNCVAGTLQMVGTTFVTPGAGVASKTPVCKSFTNTSFQIDGSKSYVIQVFNAAGGSSFAYLTDTAGNVAQYVITTNSSGTESWSGTATSTTGVFWNVSGTTAGATLAISPDGAPINESQLFTAVPTSNSSDATGWWWDFSYGGTSYFTDSGSITSTQTLNYTGNWSVEIIGTFGGANYTATENVTVVERPEANFTITSATPWMMSASIQFNDTSTADANASIASWWWDFDDGNTSTGTQNETNTFVEPGYFNVCLMVADNWGVNASADYCYNTTINGLAIDVFNEKTWAAVTNFTLTISNSTTTQTYTDRNNTFTWSNFTDGIPTGALTISVSATGYVGRTYYRSYNVNTPLNLDAYLLATTDGVYSYFITQDTLGNNLADVLLVFTFTNGSSTITAGEVKTDDTGSATMWLDWTKTYLLTASKDGYSPVTKSLTPQPTTYVIIMGSASVFNYTSVNDSLWTFMNPNNPVVNITGDTITAGVFDPDSGLTWCGLNLTFMNGTLFNVTNTSTEQMYCVLSIDLLDSGALAGEKFYAILWWTQNATDGEGQRLFNPLNTDFSLATNTADLYDYLGGPDARLIFAALLTLMAGAGAAFYLGSGSVLIMMAVSGIFVYWGWFDVGIVVAGVPGAVLLWFVAVMAGLAVLYLERGGA